MWTVMAKSGTSLERAMRRRMGMTLYNKRQISTVGSHTYRR